MPIFVFAHFPYALMIGLFPSEGVFAVDYRPLVATDDGQPHEADLSFDIEELGTYRYMSIWLLSACVILLLLVAACAVISAIEVTNLSLPVTIALRTRTFRTRSSFNLYKQSPVHRRRAILCWACAAG